VFEQGKPVKAELHGVVTLLDFCRRYMESTTSFCLHVWDLLLALAQTLRYKGVHYRQYCPPVWDILLALAQTLRYKRVHYRLLSTCVGSFACPGIGTQVQGSQLQATVHLCGIFCLPWHRQSGTREVFHYMLLSPCVGSVTCPGGDT
jgi:hypothetical protein